MDAEGGGCGLRHQMRIGTLVTLKTHTRGRNIIHSFSNGARAHGHQTVPYRPGDPLLVLYGAGGPDRLPIVQAHRGVWVGWDAGYWNRKAPDPNRSYRMTINGFHPPQYVMRGPRLDDGRWRASGLTIEQRWNPAGPIILVGNAPKSRSIGAEGWTAEKLAQIRRDLPGRRVLYRPKPKRPLEDVRADGIANGHIDDVLANASLVVCRHSNVAVDACRLGVPVVCDDGAAAAIYPNRLDGEQPNPELREEFLHRLAWWQWTMAEMQGSQFWSWFERTIGEISEPISAYGN